MVINVRGTSGAGKSHLVRSIMALYPTRTPNFIEGRRQPISYTCKRINGASLYVPGHYETPTGGCDTIQKIDDTYELVRMAADYGDVLFEGIMVGDDVRRCAELLKLHRVIVIALDTNISECLTGIQSRRDTRGDARELNPKNTIERDKRLRKSMMPRLKDAGVETHWMPRQEAFDYAKSMLGL